LWGWEPTETTKYEYRDDGKLISSTTTRESEFDTEQVAWLLASDRLESDTGRLGESLSDAMSPDADPNNWDRKFDIEVSGPTFNWVEYTLGRAQDAFYKQYPDAPRHGHNWKARLKPRPISDGSS
jgi:hypothetical protein